MVKKLLKKKRNVHHTWWSGEPKRKDKITPQVRISWYSATDGIIIFQTPWFRHNHFSRCSQAPWHNIPIIIFHPIKHTLRSYIEGASLGGSTFYCGYFKMIGVFCKMKWHLSDYWTSSSSFSLSQSYPPMRFGMFKSAVFVACMFLWKPRALSQSWSGSLHASPHRSKVFTSISEGVWMIWKGPLSVSLLVSDRQCLCSLEPFCCGVVCVWLMRLNAAI